MSKKVTISVAVLAYSRLDTLKKLIASLKKQTRLPDEIIVVFQGSDEKIWRWLSLQEGIVLHRQDNQGSAGGFSRCIQYSIKNNHDWTWILDDDAIPEESALEELIDNRYFKENLSGFISSRIIKPSGMSYMSPVPADANLWYNTVLDDSCVEVVRATWLGLLISTRAVKKAGLPLEEYFLWDEDQEYTARIARSFKCYCAIKSVITHYQNAHFDPLLPGDGMKYNHWVRNRVCTILMSDSSFLSKNLRILKWINRCVIKVIKREAPIKSLLYLLVGLLFFRPKIRFI